MKKIIISCCEVIVNDLKNFFSCWIGEVSERPAIEELSDLPFLNGKIISDEESEEESKEGLIYLFLDI